MTELNDPESGNPGSLPAAQASDPPRAAPFPTASQAQDRAGAASGSQSHAETSIGPQDGASAPGDDFVRRLVEGAHAAIDRLAEKAGPAVDSLAGAFASRSDGLSGLGAKRDEWIGDARDIIRENPLAAIAAALAVGAIYVKLTSPSRRVRDDGLDD